MIWPKQIRFCMMLHSLVVRSGTFFLHLLTWYFVLILFAVLFDVQTFLCYISYSHIFIFENFSPYGLLSFIMFFSSSTWMRFIRDQCCWIHSDRSFSLLSEAYHSATVYYILIKYFIEKIKITIKIFLMNRIVLLYFILILSLS